MGGKESEWSDLLNNLWPDFFPSSSSSYRSIHLLHMHFWFEQKALELLMMKVNFCRVEKNIEKLNEITIH